MLMRQWVAVVAAMAIAAISGRAVAKDDLLETLAQKGVITADEYERIKAQQQKPGPTLSTDDGLRLGSADGAFSIAVGTLQQIDYAAYDSDGSDFSDGSQLRRSRLSVGGNLFKDWQYRVEYEFRQSGSGNGTQITDAFVAYNALKPFVVTIGQFKPSYSMEALTADKSATFMERGLPFYLISPLFVRTPGLQLSNSGSCWSLAGGLSGAPLGDSSSGDEGWGFAARGTLAPVLTDTRVVHLGLGYVRRSPTQDNATAGTPPLPVQAISFSAKPESDQAPSMVATGNLRDTDSYQFIGGEFAVVWNTLSLQSEYHAISVSRDNGQADLDFRAWTAQLAYTLTGEKRPYRADRGVFESIRPAKPFGKDGWGAWEIAARVSQLDLNDGVVVGGALRDLTLGLSWYLNPYMRVSANYVDVLKMDRPGNVFDGQKPSAFQMRLQLAF